MENLPLEDQIREIKKMLRATMNGVLSGSMRQQGLNYRVNFGVDQPRLIELAGEMPHTAALAARLWKEDIRELRLLAPMLMPPDGMDEELALLWIEQLRFAEEAQVLVMHLLCHLPSASGIAFRLVAVGSPGVMALARSALHGQKTPLSTRCRRTARSLGERTLCPRQ